MAGCSQSDDLATLQVRLTSDLGERLKSVAVTVDTQEAAPVRRSVNVGPQAPAVLLPTVVRVPIAPSDDPVDVEVTGYAGPDLTGERLVTRRARVRPNGSDVLLDIPLEAACEAVQCPAGQTCVAGGACASEEVVITADGGVVPLPLPDAAPPAVGDAAAIDGSSVPIATDAAPPPPIPLAEHRSGSRLAVRVFRTGGQVAGSSLAFIDRTTQQPCQARTAADGVTRCLPAAFHLLGYWDAGCSQPALLIRRGQEAVPSAVSIADAGACPKRHRVYPVLAADPNRRFVHILEGPGVCSSGAEPSSVYDVHPLGPEIPAGTFATLKETLVPVTPELALRYFDGEDGSRAAFGFRDTAEGWSCEFRDIQGGPRCLPSDPVSGSGSKAFADAACSAPHLSAVDQCPVPRFRGTRTSVACGQPDSIQVHRLVPGTGYFLKQDDGTCTRINSNALHFSAGESVPLTRFASGAKSTIAPSTSRIAPRTWSIGGVQVQWGLHDQQLGVDCLPRRGPDGKLRCLPLTSGTAFTRRFSDPQCKVALGVRGCGSDEPAVLTTSEGQDSPSKYYPVLGPHQGPTYLLGDDGSCTVSTGAARAVRLGPELAIDAFAELTDEILP